MRAFRTMQKNVPLKQVLDIEGSEVIYGFVVIMEKELLNFEFGFPNMMQTFASLQTQKMEFQVKSNDSKTLQTCC